MDATMSEVVQFIQENDVKFIRLAFCDIFGNQKNIAIMPTELARAFEHGIHFNASALRGFLNVEDSDLLLFPDPGTMSVLPWRPAQGRVVRFYCDIRTAPPLRATAATCCARQAAARAAQAMPSPWVRQANSICSSWMTKAIRPPSLTTTASILTSPRLTRRKTCAARSA